MRHGSMSPDFKALINYLLYGPERAQQWFPSIKKRFGYMTLKSLMNRLLSITVSVLHKLTTVRPLITLKTCRNVRISESIWIKNPHAARMLEYSCYFGGSPRNTEGKAICSWSSSTQKKPNHNTEESKTELAEHYFMSSTAHVISCFHCWGSLRTLFVQFHVRNCICTKFSTSIKLKGNTARL